MCSSWNMHLPRVPILVEAWWGAHDVRGTASGRETLNHPKNDVLQFDYSSFQANDEARHLHAGVTFQ